MRIGNRAALVAAISLAALTAACGDKKDEAPKGQVVVTVNGDDVTVHELNSELQLLRAPPTAPRKQVEQVALQRVVERKMLADVARERGLDKNPQFLLARRRLDDGLLVQALQTDIAQKVPQTTRESAQKYIAANPSLFAERKIFTIDQIRFLRPANIAQIGLEPAKTMADVARVLSNANIRFERAPVQLDALTVNPALTKEIVRITSKNSDEVFMFADQPQGAPAPIMFVNHVTGTKVEPFIGEDAIKFAQQLIQRQEIQKALTTELAKFKTAAKPNIKYATNYAPPPEKPAATPAAGAPAAAPAPAA
ncbi:hypothetical protein [Glacieibacterium frigidum]|uniref:Peptidyl-prolyl cis-trans isomerase, EpsD family n=1 Tax=Glacieibacterium frigidum TaxID=2593303 RepID=A0A552UIA7_9SPHN|nr:hypothetical protein [Glacieibacterium frigidum]TRW17956.1 hypothetical protein FMM06_07495 [Glacieibacterium frigidum]